LALRSIGLNCKLKAPNNGERIERYCRRSWEISMQEDPKYFLNIDLCFGLSVRYVLPDREKPPPRGTPERRAVYIELRELGVLCRFDR
jgi:hypothetical protein